MPTRVARSALLSAALLAAVAAGITPGTATAQLSALPLAEVSLADDAATVELPFESYRRWMIVEAEVQGSRPLRFILDSGAPVVVLASRELGELLPLHIAGQARVGGAGDGEATQVPLATGVTVQLAGVTIENANMAVGIGSEAIPGVDGILGGALFRNLVVEIDWDRSVLRLHDPARFGYLGAASRLPLRLLESGHLVTDGIVVHGGQRLAASLLVDTGAGHALSIEPSLLEPQAALSDLIIGWGSNGIARGDIGVIDQLELGGTALGGVVTSFPAGTPWSSIGVPHGETVHGNVGQRVLRRFHVIFDVPGGNLYLEPESGFDAPFPFDTTGLALAPWAPGSDELQIVEVIPGSPAAEAGVQAGDLLIAIDGRDVAVIDATEVEAMLWGPPGGQVEISVRQGDARRSVRLTRRTLVRPRQ